MGIHIILSAAMQSPPLSYSKLHRIERSISSLVASLWSVVATSLGTTKCKRRIQPNSGNPAHNPAYAGVKRSEDVKKFSTTLWPLTVMLLHLKRGRARQSSIFMSIFSGCLIREMFDLETSVCLF
ncbi:hypothetical protein TMatcc_008771 [Talaromyces marneffei ATCC 18224]